MRAIYQFKGPGIAKARTDDSEICLAVKKAQNYYCRIGQGFFGKYLTLDYFKDSLLYIIYYLCKKALGTFESPVAVDLFAFLKSLKIFFATKNHELFGGITVQ